MPASGCRPGSRPTRRIWNRAPRVCTAHAPCQGHSDGGFVPGTAERRGTQRKGAESACSEDRNHRPGAGGG
ncbi:hypothetical protein CJU54_19215 [Pseudomonas aeruginosa]|nr:hypothetical protein CJT57_21360 [Pseudomonas aeruginosa]PBZ50685.1 hypothetical protein CJU56_23760 [Pseudomonas aeruginosa]PBZ58478.1 hypothetical protein CJU55_17080 [Pseudomonas aeruginosa]PBZ64410.1 hypothetical protein CJU54_19215 [Pseudomonas aeruginosa]RQA03556.1 hypothetical protein IPC506_19635 [Pseudomonas aeruginosa]